MQRVAQETGLGVAHSLIPHVDLEFNATKNCLKDNCLYSQGTSWVKGHHN